MKTTLKLFTLLAVITALAFGQTAATTTTISAAMTANQNTVTLASATGVSVQAGAGNQIITGLFIDKEFMRVTTLVSGTTYNVQRAQESTRQLPHASGATVWIGPLLNGPFVPTRPETSEVAGACTATASPYLPLIYLVSGHKYDCLGIAPAGQWVQTSSPGYPILGATVASPAGVLTPSGTVFTVSGTNAITGILVPNGWTPGMALYIIPSGAFTWTTATNIGLAGTAVANKLIIFVWNGVKWYPSVIA